jgi:hypothetical protein
MLLTLFGSATGGKVSRNEDSDLDLARKMLTKDLQESIRDELEKNAVRFEGKLSLMETHLKDAILNSESKIIDAVQDGAHKSIANETLRVSLFYSPMAEEVYRSFTLFCSGNMEGHGLEVNECESEALYPCSS